MPNMSNIDPSVLFYLFKGEPGVRKSTQALSFPTPQYWFSFDRKMNALNIPMREWGIDPALIEYDNYKDWTSARMKLERFQTDLTSSKSQKYRTIIIDSITTLADTILRETLKAKGMSDKGKTIGNIQVSSIEDYNAESAALNEMMALTKDIHEYHKVNVILIAHVVQTEQKTLEGRTHISRIIVTAAKKVAIKIPAVCDEIYHFNRKGGKYGMLTQHTGDDFARTTLPLDEEIMFGDEGMFDKYITPGIAKMKEPVKVTQHF